jgi:hypothetical protein
MNRAAVEFSRAAVGLRLGAERGRSFRPQDCRALGGYARAEAKEAVTSSTLTRSSLSFALRSGPERPEVLLDPDRTCRPDRARNARAEDVGLPRRVRPTMNMVISGGTGWGIREWASRSRPRSRRRSARPESVLPPLLPPQRPEGPGRPRTIQDAIHRLSSANATRQDDAVGFRTRPEALSRRRSRDRSPSGARTSAPAAGPAFGSGGQVAQLAEHAAENRGVGSSNLPLATRRVSSGPRAPGARPSARAPTGTGRPSAGTPCRRAPRVHRGCRERCGRRPSRPT